MMKKLVTKFGYRKMKYGMIALTSLSTIIFVISLVFAIISYLNFKAYTTITM